MFSSEKIEIFRISCVKNKPGGKHGHKKWHKKGSETKGFHHKANKDDFHKEKKFWDSEEKKGDFYITFPHLNTQNIKNTLESYHR